MKVPIVPRREPERPPEVPATQEHRFPCDACGGDMRFDPGQDRLVCDHCGNTAPLPSSRAPIREIAIDEGLRASGNVEQEETRVLSCPNCGATVEFDPAIHAAECPFCATPVVTDTGVNRHIKPAAVIPFVLREPQAYDAMNDWLGRLWFAPNGLQQYARKGRKMSGIYVPFWTYDAQTDSSYTGQRGDIYYVTQTVMRDGKPVQVQVPRTRWTPVRGRVARFFDDVVILASRSLPKSHTDALQPWDMAALSPYAPQYLAGFRAEAYQVDLEAGLVEARAHMEAVIARDVRMDIGGDQQQITTLDTRLSDVTFKHVLLPVWVAAYKYRGQSYRFVVNGQTGRVQGERPYSKWKIALAVLAALIVAAIVGLIAAQAR
ncbi:primosomal protein N' (replication factor Y) - superfamily II helicase [Jannaschia rubra]|uniref:primosomal protein N' (replication factor Y) - superfamily II helicase n=1 Tax=Jannaschia rubra TaxID=282197 RepID=UPI002493734B|nr:primosomal protein N' (replication factor Y) - superfamily II helicase [Jannaschia rubra]